LKKRQFIADSLNNRADVLSPLHPSSRIRSEIRTHYSANVESALTIVSLAFGDGLGAGYTLETFNETEESIRVVLNNRKKYLTALEILHKHNIKVATSSLLTPQEDPTPLKVLMKTPSQRSFQSINTSSYQNPTPSSMLQQEDYESAAAGGGGSSGGNAVVMEEDCEEEIEDVTENCVAATDYHEMKGRLISALLQPLPESDLFVMLVL
jgi:hypothetical protein